jgi:CBS domain containing-hemolysin-like protein
VRIDAKMDLEDFLHILENYLNTKMTNTKSFEVINHIKNNLEESRTVGGFICSFTGKIPLANTYLTIGEILFRIVEAGPRRINTVEFSLKEQENKNERSI